MEGFPERWGGPNKGLDVESNESSLHYEVCVGRGGRQADVSVWLLSLKGS